MANHLLHKLRIKYHRWMAVGFENHTDSVAIKHVIWLAALEDEWGLLELGCRYSTVQSISKNTNLALVYWHRTLSKNGDLSKYAAANIAEHYLRSPEVSRPSNEAITWLKLASELGHPQSQYNYGLSLIEGIITEQDQVRGAEWLKMAAKSGVSEAALLLQKIGSI
jgi:TPR repeat protein